MTTGLNYRFQSSIPSTPPHLAVTHKTDFDDAKTTYGGKTLGSLLRSYVVFSLCTIGPLVRNSESLFKLSNQVFGTTLTEFVVKKTFFAHFCGGEDVQGLRPTIKELNANGINGILDYAAENAPDEQEAKPSAKVIHVTLDEDTTCMETNPDDQPAR
jgi:hypothetical protein